MAKKRECKLFLRRISDGHIYSYSHYLAREPGFQVVNKDQKIIRPALRERARLKAVQNQFDGSAFADIPPTGSPVVEDGAVEAPDEAPTGSALDEDQLPSFTRMKKEDLVDYAETVFGETLDGSLKKDELIQRITDMHNRAEEGPDAEIEA